MEIVTLVENTSCDANLTGEHGLSLHITSRDRTLLFDMGASDSFMNNASVLGMNLSLVDAAVLSHAHSDHGGGLAHFLAVNEKADVYLKAGAAGDYYANIGARMPLWLLGSVYPLVSHSLLFSRYIGLDKTLFQNHGHRLRLLTGDTDVEEHISILTQFKGNYPRSEGNKFLLENTGSRLDPDLFAHELVLVVQEPDGLVLFTGCGHSGILNMVAGMRKAYPKQPIKAVVGGFHLAYQPGKSAIAGKREDIECIANELIKTGVKKVYTGHCTGDEAYAILKGILGDKLGRLYTGARITL